METWEAGPSKTVPLTLSFLICNEGHDILFVILAFSVCQTTLWKGELVKVLEWTAEMFLLILQETGEHGKQTLISCLPAHLLFGILLVCLKCVT